MKLIRSGPLAPIADVLEEAIGEVFSGELDASRGHAIASLARSVVLLVDTAVTAERIEAIETELAAIKAGGPVETYGRPRVVTEEVPR